jgi:SAM-dependent methyltransferase
MDTTRESWNIATRNHNGHKGDQAAFFRAGGSTLFPEERGLLGDLSGLRVAHLQCNAGQDTLSLYDLGRPAALVGVDLSDEAIAFATQLSVDTDRPARFIRGDVVQWLAACEDRFDVVFTSYGALGWLPDLDAYFRGVRRVLAPGGRFVYVEFHPLVWSVDAEHRLKGDDYFAAAPFSAPVGDYVAQAGTGLNAVSDGRTAGENAVPATSYQHTLGVQVSALVGAGLQLVELVEYPFANGCPVSAGLVREADASSRRWRWPEGVAQVPAMFSVVARAPRG